MNSKLRAFAVIFALFVPGSVFAQTVTPEAPTSITNTSAVLHGTVTPANQLTTVRFLWGKTVEVYSDSAEAIESPIAGTNAQNVNYPVSSLEVNTTYYVIISATSNAGYVRSNEITFTTTAMSPAIGSVHIVAKTDTAYLSFAVTPNNAATTITVAYGSSASYGLSASVTPSTANGDTLTNVTATLGTLTPFATYHYQVSAGNISGTTTTNDSTFTTKSLPPTISSFSPTGGKTGTQVTINGSNFDATTNIMFQGDGSIIRTLNGPIAVLSVAYSPNGLTLASGSNDNTINLWRVSDGSLIRTLTGHTDYVFSVAYSPDGQTIASGSGSGDQTIKLWRVSDGVLIRTLIGHTSIVLSVAFSPDGQTIASGSGDQTIKLWRVSDGVLIRTLTGHTSNVRSVAFSPDGQTIASGSADQTIKLWRVSDGALIRTLTGHTSGVFSVAFSPDGQTIASGSVDNTINLWRVSDGALIRTLTGHTSIVFSVAFSPDGQTIASGSADQTIKLWRVSDGVLIRTLTGHTSTVSSVVYNPDGLTLASGSYDNTIKLWLIRNKSTISINSSSSLTAVVPPNSATGKIAVENSGGFGISANDFTFYPQPIITSFTPATGIIGTTVTVNGKKFTGTSTVTFGAITASSFNVMSDTIIAATASTGGVIAVSTPGGDTISNAPFIVPPLVTTGDVQNISDTTCVVQVTLNPKGTPSITSILLGKSSGQYTDTITVNSQSYQGQVDSVFIMTLNNLSASTSHYYRGYAHNAAGFSKGIEKSFKTVIATPKLSFPPNAAGNVSTVLSLGWSMDVNADYYHLQVALDSSFSQLVFEDSLLTINSATISSLNFLTKYFWRGRSRNNISRSSYSKFFSFTTIIQAPSVPVLVSPTNGASGQSTSRTLQWSPAARAEKYHLQVMIDTTGLVLSPSGHGLRKEKYQNSSVAEATATFIVDDSTLTDTSYLLSSLSNNTSYYWRVNATNINGTSGYSTTWRFTTILATPVLQLPADNTTNTSVSPVLSWSAISGTTNYQLQVSTDSLFTTMVINDSSIAANSSQVGPISNSTKYYWRVQARNVLSNSAYSSTFSFTTIIQAPFIPVLISPTNGSAGNPTSLTLQWNASQRAEKYHLQVTTDTTLTAFLIVNQGEGKQKYRAKSYAEATSFIVNDSTLTGTSYALSSLTNNTTYYWRVSASNINGTSGYSTKWSFTTILATPVLQSPANNTTNISVRPTLSWSAISGLTNYQLQISSDSLSSNLVLDDSTLTTDSSQVGPLSYSTKYYWRVRAKNALSNSVYSSTFNFRTIIQAPPTPALVSPADGSSGQPTSLTLQWSPAARAEKYHLQLTTDTTTNSLTVNDSTITATTRAVAGLLQSTRYFWRVRSINVGGRSEFTSYWSFYTNLDGPTFVTAGAGNHKATISWIKSTLPNIIWYRVHRGTVSPATVLRDSVSSSQSTYMDSGLVNGTKYFYRVTGVNNYGDQSSFSNEASATPINSPPVAVKLQNINENNAGRVLKKTFTYSSLGSHDTDGRIDSVQWYVNDIYFSKADSLTYDYTQGTTKVMLRVFDSDKASDSSIAYVNRTLFMTEVNGPVYGGVTLLGDSILYAVASSDAVYRLDNNGNIVYPLQVGGEIRTATSISNDHVVYIASSDKNLYAFGSSGTAIWPPRPQGAVVSASVTIDTFANRLYVGIQNRNFVAVNRSDGSNVWNFFSDAPIAQSAVINADRTLIFSTTKGTIYGIDLNNLSSPVAPTWTLSIGDTITTSPAIDIQRAYYVGTSGGSIIKFVKIQNQPPNIVWEFPTGGRIEASPIIDGAGIVYVGSTDSSLYAINSVTGGLKWIYRTNGKIKTTGAVTNQRVVYAGNESGELIALDSLGNKIWYYRADSSISSTIIANKGSLYFGTYGKKVIGIFDGGSQTQQLGKNAALSEPQWGTFQGNNQRTGVQSSTLLYVQNQEKTPISFTLSQNYPNPFNPSTTLQYGIPITSRVSLRIYNVLGQLVADLIDGEQAAGWYSVRWNADVSTGIYFYRIDAASVNDPNNRFVQVKKMLLLK